MGHLRTLALLGAVFSSAPLWAAEAATEPAAASASDAPTRHSLLVLDLEPIDVDVDKMKIINGTVVDVLSGYAALEIIAQGDIRQMVDFEAEKQAMGCDTTSCLAEIAGAMGASYVLFGRVGRLDDVLFVQLNLFDSSKGRTIAREEVRAQKLSELPDLVRPALARLVAPLTGEEPPAPVVAQQAEPASDGGLSGPLLWGGAALAGLGLVGGGALTVGALWAELTLGEIGADIAQKNVAADLGPWMFGGALVGAAVTAGGLALSGVALVVE